MSEIERQLRVRRNAAWWYGMARENIRSARRFSKLADESESLNLREYVVTLLCFAIYERDVARLARRGVYPSLWPAVPEALQVRPRPRRKKRRNAA